MIDYRKFMTAKEYLDIKRKIEKEKEQKEDKKQNINDTKM